MKFKFLPVLLLIFFILLSGFVSADLTTNIESYYTLDSVYTDSLGLNNGTGTGTTFTTGIINNGVLFNAVTDKVLIANEGNFDFERTDSFSVNFWAKKNSYATSFYVCKQLASGSFAGWCIWQNGNNIDFSLVSTGSNKIEELYDVSGFSGFFMVTLTYDGSVTNAGLKMYINGSEVATTGNVNSLTTSILNNVQLELGNRNGAFNFDGVLDEVGIWNKELSSSEVLSLYNSGVGFQYPFSNITISNFSITAKSYWDNSSLNNFSADINGSIYNTTTGTITTDILQNSTSLYNITIYADDWFNTTYLNYNVSSNLVGSLNQSYITIAPLELISNNSLNNFSIKIGSDVVCNTTGTTCTFNPDANNYTLTLIDNAGLETYHTTSNDIEVFALDNLTINIYGHAHELFIYARTITNNTINNFTATLSSLNITDNRILNTSSGVVNFDAIHNTYNISVDAPGYALDDSQLISIEAGQQNYSLYFYLYTTNSINITFKDETTNNIIDYTNISLEIISDVESGNYSTSNGTLYIDLLTPSYYSLRYSDGSTYPERFYYLTLEDRSHTDLTLYLLNNSENITITLYDQYNNYVEDAYIKVLRYDIASNSYEVKEIIKTNFQGIAKFLGVLNTEYYKFIVEYPQGNTIKTTSPSYLYTNTLIIQILTGAEVGIGFNNFASIDYTSISFNNETNNFRFTYNDKNNIITEMCLNIYKINNINGDTLIKSSCSSSSAATLLAEITPINNSKYVAKAYATIDAETEIIDVYTLEYGYGKQTDENDIVAAIILTLLISFLGIWSLPVFILSVPLGIIFSIALGFLNIPISIGIGLEMIALTIVILISNKS